MQALAAICAAMLWAVLSSLPARAFVPPPERIADAVAAANRGAGRFRVLEIGVALYLGGSEEPAATGKLMSDPGGFSRLELHDPQGRVERHLLRGREVLASRDRQPLDAPRPLLPPLFLLQANSGSALMVSLAALGVSADEVALGYQGERDCYVLGGRASASGIAAPHPKPALWVDQETLEPLRFDRGDGVRFRLGPFASFGSARLPSWIEIADSRGFLARLAILSAREAPSAPESFRQGWLGAP